MARDLSQAEQLYSNALISAETATEALGVEAPTYTSVSVPIETYRVKTPRVSAAVEAAAAYTVEQLRRDVENLRMIVVSDVEVESTDEYVVASVRYLVDPPDAVRAHVGDRVRVQPTVGSITFGLTPPLGPRGSVVVDGRRPVRETRRVSHDDHERPDPNCEQCQAAIFEETRRRAADYARDRALDSDSDRGLA